MFVPKALTEYLSTEDPRLRGHEGFDFGAAEVSRSISEALNAKLLIFHITRLLIDSNRSWESQKKKVANYSEEALDTVKSAYFNYRNTGFDLVESYTALEAHCLVLSIHSFTPIYKGKARRTDIGLLFRTGIKKEFKLANCLKTSLADSGYTIHLNQPYQGYTDCYVNDISDKYLNHPMVGLCIELNHRILKNPNSRRKVSDCLVAAITEFAQSQRL